jgi:hypothetical protein
VWPSAFSQRTGAAFYYTGFTDVSSTALRELGIAENVPADSTFDVVRRKLHEEAAAISIPPLFE